MVTMYKAYRTDCLVRGLNVARFNPLDVLVVGATGAGKSTTLNTLFSQEVASVGTGADPETMELNHYSLSDRMRFWDSPGLGDSIEADIEHSHNIIDLLYKTYSLDNKTYGWIDLVLVILDGSGRDMGTAYKLLNHVVLPNINSKRVLVGINQADIAMKGRNWDRVNRRPLAILQNFLNTQAESVMRRVKEATGLNIIQPVHYSAEYNYNLHSVLDLIINNIPTERRLLNHTN